MTEQDAAPMEQVAGPAPGCFPVTWHSGVHAALVSPYLMERMHWVLKSRKGRFGKRAEMKYVVVHVVSTVEISVV